MFFRFTGWVDPPSTDLPLDGVVVGAGGFRRSRVSVIALRCDICYDRARFAEFGGSFDEEAAPRGDPKKL